MTALKTKQNTLSVSSFLNSVEDKDKRRDCRELQALMQDITGKKPTMWGTSIVGFGRYHYKYDTGREGEWFLTGFSPRKQNLGIPAAPANLPSSYLPIRAPDLIRPAHFDGDSNHKLF
jgi:hypothetical protein